MLQQDWRYEVIRHSTHGSNGSLNINLSKFQLNIQI